MALKINASDLVTRRVLAVSGEGVEFQETALMGGTRRFSFRQIDCLLLSGNGVLSFQAGREVFRIQTKLSNREHQELIETLVRELQASV
jgi:hypothetical protein